MPPGLTCYAPLARLRKRQGIASTDTGDDLYWLDKLRAASSEIDTYTNRSFVPVLETRKFDWADPTRLTFRSQELLSPAVGASAPFVTSVIDGSGKTIDPTSIILQGAANDSVGPFYGLDLDPTKAYLLYLTTPIRAISVTGVWGYHTDWANAFHSSGVMVQDSPLTSGATTITTSQNDGTAYDSWGQNWPTGTVQPGHLLQIDNEWLWAVRQISATQTVVVRGVNGTTAASHPQNTPILIYEPPAAIVEACTMYSAFLIARDSGDFGKSALPQVGGTTTPSAPPADFLSKLTPFVKKRVA